MPRISGKIPSYGRHKASGKAVVRLRGKDHYLGDFGTAESHERYERLVCEWRSQQVEVTAPMAPVVSASKSRELTIADVLFRYRQFAESYYVKNGKPSKELTYIRYALRPLRELYGSLKIREFGPLALKAVRQHMIDSDLSRKLINGRIDRVKRFMKWAVSEELAPASAYEAVRAVAGLRFGKTAARETDPVKPVPDAWVNAILPQVSRHVAGMIQLQRLTGMRPCEVVMMRACDIDMSAEIWIYVPFEHKNQWRGHQRQIPLGPKAQEIIRQFLTLSTTAFLFSPQAAEVERNEKRRKNRKTPMTPSQAGRKQKPKPLRRKRESYDVDSYRRAITYGIKSANRKRKADEQVPHDTRDQIVDYVQRWTDRAELPAGKFIAWLGISSSKFYDWKQRYGQVNEHNGQVPRDWWLEKWEKDGGVVAGNHAATSIFRRIAIWVKKSRESN